MTTSRIDAPRDKNTGCAGAVVQPTSINASHMRAALRRFFAAPEYAVLEEVRNATGRQKVRHGKRARYADMLVMALYPSAGLEIFGVEIKVSRADWRNEIKDPTKAEAVAKYCDRWYVAVSDPSFIKEGELPVGWGVLTIKGDEIVVMTTACKRKDTLPVDRAFLASLLRNATTSNQSYADTHAQVDMAVRAETRRKAKERRSVADSEIARLRNKLAHYERMDSAWMSSDIELAGMKMNQVPQELAGLMMQG